MPQKPSRRIDQSVIERNRAEAQQVPGGPTTPLVPRVGTVRLPRALNLSSISDAFKDITDTVNATLDLEGEASAEEQLVAFRKSDKGPDAIAAGLLLAGETAAGKEHYLDGVARIMLTGVRKELAADLEQFDTDIASGARVSHDPESEVRLLFSKYKKRLEDGLGQTVYSAKNLAKFLDDGPFDSIFAQSVRNAKVAKTAAMQQNAAEAITEDFRTLALDILASPGPDPWVNPLATGDRREPDYSRQGDFQSRLDNIYAHLGPAAAWKIASDGLVAVGDSLLANTDPVSGENVFDVEEVSRALETIAEKFTMKIPKSEDSPGGNRGRKNLLDHSQVGPTLNGYLLRLQSRQGTDSKRAEEKLDNAFVAQAAELGQAIDFSVRGNWRNPATGETERTPADFDFENSLALVAAAAFPGDTAWSADRRSDFVTEGRKRRDAALTAFSNLDTHRASLANKGVIRALGNLTNVADVVRWSKTDAANNNAFVSPAEVAALVQGRISAITHGHEKRDAYTGTQERFKRQATVASAAVFGTTPAATAQVAAALATDRASLDRRIQGALADPKNEDLTDSQRAALIDGLIRDFKGPAVGNLLKRIDSVRSAKEKYELNVMKGLDDDAEARRKLSEAGLTLAYFNKWEETRAKRQKVVLSDRASNASTAGLSMIHRLSIDPGASPAVWAGLVKTPLDAEGVPVKLDQTPVTRVVSDYRRLFLDVARESWKRHAEASPHLSVVRLADEVAKDLEAFNAEFFKLAAPGDFPGPPDAGKEGETPEDRAKRIDEEIKKITTNESRRRAPEAERSLVRVIKTAKGLINTMINNPDESAGTMAQGLTGDLAASNQMSWGEHAKDEGRPAGTFKVPTDFPSSASVRDDPQGRRRGMIFGSPGMYIEQRFGREPIENEIGNRWLRLDDTNNLGEVLIRAWHGDYKARTSIHSYLYALRIEKPHQFYTDGAARSALTVIGIPHNVITNGGSFSALGLRGHHSGSRANSSSGGERPYTKADLEEIHEENHRVAVTQRVHPPLVKHFERFFGVSSKDHVDILNSLNNKADAYEEGYEIELEKLDLVFKDLLKIPIYVSIEQLEHFVNKPKYMENLSIALGKYTTRKVPLSKGALAEFIDLQRTMIEHRDAVWGRTVSN